MSTKFKRSVSKNAIAAFMVAFLFSLGVGGNTPASAEEPVAPPPSCDVVNPTTTPNGMCADVDAAESHSHSSSKSRAVAVNGVKLTSSVTVLANIRANGTPAAQQTDCYNTTEAMSLWTSYNAEGTTGWHWKSYPKGYRFCKFDGAVRDPKCHNKVKIGVPKSKPPKNAISGEVKFVKRLKWEVKAVAKADEKVASHAKAWCTGSSSTGYGEGSGSASAYAVGRASLKGRVLVKLLVEVKAAAAGDLSAQLGGKSLIQVKGELKSSAFAKATSDAFAQAKCTELPPPPPPHDECPDIPGDQPPGYDCNPKTPPVIVDMKRINDLNPGWTTPVCAKADFQDAHSGTLTFSFESGGITGTNPVTVADMQEGCATLVAPTDPGTYTYKVTATDSVTGASVTRESQTFVVWASPPPPP